MKVLDKKINGLNVCVIDKNDKEFPKNCKDLKDFPNELYFVGKLPDFNKKSICITGARNCSDYGMEVSRSLSRVCVSNDISIVTGLALGCETSALLGALVEKKSCTAVLFSGVDICYPQYNQKIYDEILENGGCIISPFPLGTEPLPINIMLKNKVITGLADSVVLVEGKMSSGSFALADNALVYDKNVFAVPGRIGDCLSEGPNYLIKQGAFVVSNVNDILQYYRVIDDKNINKKYVNLKSLDYFQQLIVDELSDGGCHNLDDIAKCIKIPYEKCRAVLTSLSVLGMVEEHAPSQFTLDVKYINFKANENNDKSIESHEEESEAPEI